MITERWIVYSSELQDFVGNSVETLDEAYLKRIEIAREMRLNPRMMKKKLMIAQRLYSNGREISYDEYVRGYAS